MAMNGGVFGINSVVLIFAGEYSVRTTVTASAQVASSWVNDVVRDYGSSSSDLGQVIGFATQSQPNLLPGDDHPVAILQLCVDDKCLIFQLLHSNSVIPPVLSSFLDDDRFLFVGVDVFSDADRLWSEHGLFVRSAVDLRDAVAEHLERPDLQMADLKRLVREVMAVEMERPEEVRTSEWQQLVLSPQQIAFACADALASFQVGTIVVN